MLSTTWPLDFPFSRLMLCKIIFFHNFLSEIYWGFTGTSTLLKETLDLFSQRRLKMLFHAISNFKEDLQLKMQVSPTKPLVKAYQLLSNITAFQVSIALCCSKDHRSHAGEFDTTCSRYKSYQYINSLLNPCPHWCYLLLQHMQGWCLEMRLHD